MNKANTVAGWVTGYILGFIVTWCALFVLWPHVPKNTPQFESGTFEYYQDLHRKGYNSQLAAYCDEYPDRDIGLHVKTYEGVSVSYRTCYGAAQAGAIPDNNYLNWEE